MPRVACIQLNTQDNLEASIAQVSSMVREAAANGAQFIALPENCSTMQEHGARLKEVSPLESAHPMVELMGRLAKDVSAWLLAGSIPVSLPGTDKLANRSLLFAPDGRMAARYDKLHLFDADPGDARAYTESNRYVAGDQVVRHDLGFAQLGMTICYDLRFPYLFSALAKGGAQIISVPSAFTYTTGKAHWHVLLRARAIETGCYIVAPAQCGTHPGNRRTYGHSLIISPWGEILAEASEDTPEIIYGEIDVAACDDARRKIPCLKAYRVL
jgi:predicted amidohydrolase